MEVGSVGVNAYAKTSVQSGERAQQAQQARQAEQQAQQAAQSEEKKAPVRNAEGQVTGKQVNTTA